jgi:hypothetical protein
MDLTFQCSCGKSHVIQPTQAGELLTCSCGLEQVLPSLSKLRASAGLTPFETSTPTAIWAALRSGELELGDSCVACSVPTQSVYAIWAVCERSYRHVSGGVQANIAFVVPVAEAEVREEHRGRDVIVPLPIRLCERCAGQIDRDWPGRLLATLRWLLIASGIVVLVLALAFPVLRVPVELRWSAYLLAVAFVVFVAEYAYTAKRQAMLKSLVGKVPAFSSLIREYPHAELALAKAEVTQ